MNLTNDYPLPYKITFFFDIMNNVIWKKVQENILEICSLM